ncbi:MAG TPA: HAD family hydrolase [Candidatus Pacearchaeota archaeon]|nr:dUMP phosphatase [archaeon BMS3Abin17]HDK42018.1 HAD family hydrolase [Candidatus Pacearchaeota archaeon]HDZ60276.1 HAD family hydrolase [Candidatus Pacearchaeota archaeon]
MVKAIFFDWMRTLANIGELVPLNHILNKDESKNLLTNPIENLNISEEKKREIRKVLSDVKDIRLYPDSEEVISLLKSNYHLAIVSNMYPITNDFVRKFFQSFLNKFDVVSLSIETGFSKPDKNFLLYTLNNLNKIKGTNIKPNEVLVIGDSETHDIKPALEAGMKAKIINRENENLKDILGDLI